MVKIALILNSDREEYSSPVIEVIGGHSDEQVNNKLASYCEAHWQEGWGGQPETTTGLIEAYFQKSTDWLELREINLVA